MALKTIRRDVLKRLVENDKVEAKCNYRYTDDYIGDNADNFGKSDYMPCRIIKDNSEFKEGYMNLRDFDFKTKSGMAYKDDNGEIRLIVHSNLSYTLRVKE